MLKQFRSALADGREYYLPGYVPKNRTQDSTFRSVRVEVADKKLHVRAVIPGPLLLPFFASAFG
jgi:hypothetical protein